MTFHLELSNADGQVNITEENSVEIVFVDCCGTEVLKKSILGTNISNNAVRVDFDDATTAKFPVGEYTYDMDLIGPSYRTSIISKNKAIVS